MTNRIEEQCAVSIAAALARSRIYRFLGSAFLPPGENLAPLLSEAQEIVAYLLYDNVGAHGRAPLHQAIEEVASTLEGTSPDDLQTAYRWIFGHTISQGCPPYETQYGGGHIFQQTQILGDISGFYRAFGLETSDETKERPDHISVELEFMYILAYKEAYALAHEQGEQAEICRDAQRMFVEEHVGRWIPLFARQLGEQVNGFYRALAEVVAIFIDLEADFLQAEPSPLTTLEPMGYAEDGIEETATEDSL
jgi:DMSO reductase family type II enzyme chaperone